MGQFGEEGTQVNKQLETSGYVLLKKELWKSKAEEKGAGENFSEVAALI